MSDHEMAVRAVRGSIRGTLSVRYVLWAVAVFGFAYGSVVLIGRAVIGWEREPLLWGLTGVAAAAAAGLWMARRRVPTVAQVRAVVDRHAYAGGLVMAAEETAIGAWAGRVRTSRRPVVAWRSGRAVGIALAAGLFVALGFLAPRNMLSSASASPLDISSQAERLAEQIKLLEEQEVLEASEAEELAEQLEQVRRDATTEDPSRTWESLDHLAESLSDSAREAAEKAISQTEQLSETEMLAEGLAENGAETEAALDDEKTSEAMKKLSEMVEELAEANKAFEKALAEQGVNAGQLAQIAQQLAAAAGLTAEQLAEQGGQLTPEQMQQLAEQMAQLTPEQLQQLQKLAGAAQAAKLGMEGDLRRLADARLIDPKQLEACKNAGQCDGTGLALFLSQCMGEGMGLNESLKLWSWNQSLSQRPGRGGVTRGRGDAEMTWKDPSDPNGSSFEAQTLPQASMDALRDSAMVGVSLGAPEASTEGPDRSNAVAGSAAGGGSANRQVVLPRHKRAVSRYFDR